MSDDKILNVTMVLILVLGFIGAMTLCCVLIFLVPMLGMMILAVFAQFAQVLGGV